MQREQLSARDTEALHQRIGRSLDRIGMETQPEVASRILAVAADPDSGPSDYAKVIKQDASISGRLLRVANSAYFAQRDGVSSVERACVVLGLERIKAVSLGFFLARSAASDENSELSRRVWGQSLFRACLASEIARIHAPGRSPEAFVIGLLLDCGVALMPKLLGNRYHMLLEGDPTPTKLLRRELEELEYTHADVASVLTERWALPELLSKPIEWRHVPPGAAENAGELQRLQRIAHYAGAIALSPETGEPMQDAPMSATAERLLNLPSDKLAGAVSRATKEYEITMGLFGDFAEAMSDPEDVAAFAHAQLNQIIEQTLVAPDSESETADTPGRPVFTFDAGEIELRVNGDDVHIAVLRTPEGEEIVSYRFVASAETAERVLESLGLDPDPCEELERMRAAITRLAA